MMTQTDTSHKKDCMITTGPYKATDLIHSYIHTHNTHTNQDFNKKAVTMSERVHKYKMFDIKLVLL